MTDLERKQLIVGLKALHTQTLNFVTRQKKKCAKSTLEKIKKRNAELEDYIKLIENGGDSTRTLREWCNLFGDIYGRRNL